MLEDICYQKIVHGTSLLFFCYLNSYSYLSTTPIIFFVVISYSTVHVTRYNVFLQFVHLVLQLCPSFPFSLCHYHSVHTQKILPSPLFVKRGLLCCSFLSSIHFSCSCINKGSHKQRIIRTTQSLQQQEKKCIRQVVAMRMAFDSL